MPRFRLVWLEIADRQYRELPDATRVLIDRRLAQLVENPPSTRTLTTTSAPTSGACRLAPMRCCSTPSYGSRLTVIVLRLVSFA